MHDESKPMGGKKGYVAVADDNQEEGRPSTSTYGRPSTEDESARLV